MIVSIHQPNFIPWIGYFYKIACSDCFILLDDVEYTKNSYINRNRIKTPHGVRWLTVPVMYAGNSKKPINEIIISAPGKTYKSLAGVIKSNYTATKYFDLYQEPISEIFSFNYSFLYQLNMSLISFVMHELDINVKIIRSSEIENIKGKATERLVSLCKAVGATTYLSGFGGFNYQDEQLFIRNNIVCKSYEFKHPVYTQIWGEFVPNMSVLDLLFNTGHEAKRLFSTILKK